MRDTTLLQFKIKNDALGDIMQRVPVRATVDKQGIYTFRTVSPWYSEDCIDLDVPAGKSIAQWIADLMSDPFKHMATLYRFKEAKQSIEEEINRKGFDYWDKETITAEIEVCNIRWSFTEDTSNYAYEKRTENETTIIRLTAEEWRRNPAHEPFAEALAGDTSKIRQYAKKLGNIKIIPCIVKKEETPAVQMPAIAEMPEYIAELARPEDWEYQVKKGEVLLTKYIGSETNIYIPAEIDGLPVTTLSYWVLGDNESCRRIYMPDTIKTIDRMWFGYGCNHIEEIRLSQNLVEIGQMAFSMIKAEILDIPATVISIKGGAFDSEALRQVIIRGDPKIATNLKLFGWAPKMTVHAPKGSKVAEYCKKQGIPVEFLD